LRNVGRVLNPSSAAKQPPSAADGLRTRSTWLLDALIIAAAIGTWIGAISPRMTTKFPAMLLVVLIIARQAGAIRRALERSRFPLELWIAALWIVIGFLGSLGFNSFFHSFFF